MENRLAKGRKFTLRTLSVAVAISIVLFAASCLAPWEAEASAENKPDRIEAPISLVVGNTIVMYVDNGAGMKVGDTYSAFVENKPVGEIVITVVAKQYTKADIIEGKFLPEEGGKVRLEIKRPPPPADDPTEINTDQAQITEEPIEKEIEEKPAVVSRPTVESIPETPAERKNPHVRSAGFDRDERIQVGTTYETHSDKERPDDYLIGVISYSISISRSVRSNLFYIYRYNLETSKTGNQSAGVSFIKPLGYGLSMLAGYSTSKYWAETGRSEEFTGERARLGLYKRLKDDHRGGGMVASLNYSTAADWSENRTLSVGIEHTMFIDRDAFLNGGYIYTYGYNDVDAHIYDQWYVNYSRRFSTNKRLIAGYTFVKKSYNYGDIGIRPDDDNVFRLGIVADLRGGREKTK